VNSHLLPINILWATTEAYQGCYGIKSLLPAIQYSKKS